MHSGDLEKLQKLVENKVDPNQGDYDKRTAVHLVIYVYTVSLTKFFDHCDKKGGFGRTRDSD